MISVLTLFQTVQDLARKEQKGYQSAVEFTRKLKLAELNLLDYFHRLYERDQEVVDSVAPLIARATLDVVEGVVTKPPDYAHRVSIASVELANDCNGTIVKTQRPCYYLRRNQVDEIVSDAVAFPSVEAGRYYHYFEEDKIKVIPVV